MTRKRPKISYRELMRGEGEASAPANASEASTTPSVEPTIAAAPPIVAAAEPTVAAAEPTVPAAEPIVAATKPIVVAAEPIVAAAEPEVAAAEPEPDPADLTVSRVDWRVVPDIIATPTLASSEPTLADARGGMERRRSDSSVRAPVDDPPPSRTHASPAARTPAPSRTPPASPPVAPLPMPARHGGRTFVLLFRVGTERFAMSLASVDEAVDLPDVHPLPEMPDGMLGIFNLRGRMMPLFSPLRALGVVPASPPRAALVIHGSEQPTAVAVDDVDDVLEIDLGALHYAPGAGDADGVLLGIVHRGGDLIAVVNASCVVSACEPGRVAEVA